MVLIFHTSGNVANAPYFKSFPSLIEHLSRGVQLFFIISAFSLFKTSEVRWHQESRPVLSFYIRRSFRILPLWWLAVLLYRIFWNIQHPLWETFATAFFYFGFFKSAFFIALPSAGWSLFVEETFYLFFPLWKKLIKTLRNAFIAIVLSYLVAWLWFEKSGQLFNLNPALHFQAIFPLANYYAFFIGIAFFYLRKDHLMRFLNKDVSLPIKLALDLSALSGFIVLFFYDRMVGSLALAPFILASFFSKTLVGKLTRSSLLTQFGTYCYSIYLFQSLLFQKLKFMQNDYFKLLHISDAPQEIQTLLWFLPICACSFVIGFITFRYLERPLVGWGKKVIERCFAK